MSTTLLPFLYQTRTLQRLSRARVATPVFRSRSLFHATTRASLPRDRLTRRPSKDVIAFEMPSDVDIIDEPEDLEPGQRSTITPTERDAFNRIFEEIAARGTRSSENPASPTAKASPLPAGSSPLAASIGRKANTGSKHAREFVNAIFQDAAAELADKRSAAKNPYPLLHPLGQLDASRDPARALLRFPPSLRRAARMAMGVIDQENQLDGRWSKDDLSRGIDVWAGGEEEEEAEPDVGKIILDDIVSDPMSKSVKTEAMRRMERNRVEGLMRDANTDFELWDVMEAEVFTLVDKLGLSDNQPPPQKKRGSKKRAAAAAAAADGEASNGNNEDRASMHLYGPLYPSYLLSALRSMDTRFDRSSSLALNILPRIKELGLASYVLGVSTSFYNALAGIYWRRYGNPEAVFNLYEEMRHAGLYCDADSMAIILSIDTAFKRASAGETGPFLKEIISLPEYEYGLKHRVTHWIKTIDVQIGESKWELRR